MKILIYTWGPFGIYFYFFSYALMGLNQKNVFGQIYRSSKQGLILMAILKRSAIISQNARTDEDEIEYDLIKMRCNIMLPNKFQNTRSSQHNPISAQNCTELITIGMMANGPLNLSSVFSFLIQSIIYFMVFKARFEQ